MVKNRYKFELHNNRFTNASHNSWRKGKTLVIIIDIRGAFYLSRKWPHFPVLFHLVSYVYSIFHVVYIFLAKVKLDITINFVNKLWQFPQFISFSFIWYTCDYKWSLFLLMIWYILLKWVRTITQDGNGINIIFLILKS